jgi:uncharacterized protein (TIGR00730 family)
MTNTIAGAAEVESRPAARTVAVFGSARVEPGSQEYEEARTLGRSLAGAGFVVKTGGYYGAMEAVSAGARERGAHVIGVTLRPFRERRPPNTYVLEEQEAEDLFARVRGLVHSDAWIALPGGIGTLAEVALTWNLLQHEESLRRPLVLVGDRWRALLPELMEHLVVDGTDAELVRVVDGPREALHAVVDGLA